MSDSTASEWSTKSATLSSGVPEQLLRRLIREEVRNYMFHRLHSEHIAPESIIPRKIRGVGAGGVAGQKLTLLTDSQGKVYAGWA